jgi:cytochrome c peroxidase
VALLNQLNYAPAFRAAYPQDSDAVTPANYARAIAAYQATLKTPAPFDRFLAGDEAALAEQQQQGLRTFIATGCAGCHNGPLFGGISLQRFGVVRDYWKETGSEPVDVGRFAVSKKEEERYVFRVPMLRNVAKTAPYFHDGSVERLDRAVKIMAGVQLGLALSDAQIAGIVSFLGSLTGEVPAHYAPPGQKPGL